MSECISLISARPLFCPGLEELRAAILSAHTAHPIYSDFSCEVVRRDGVEWDMQEDTYFLAGDRNFLIDFGGVANMNEPSRHNITFDLHDIIDHASRAVAENYPSTQEQSCYRTSFGAAAAEPSAAGGNAEGILSCAWADKFSNSSRVTRILKNSEKKIHQSSNDDNRMECVAAEPCAQPFETLRYTTPKVGCLGNIFCAERKSGSAKNSRETLWIEAKGRIKTGDECHSFTCWLREILTDKFKGKVVGLGGIFDVLSGYIKGHVMPDFLNVPITTTQQCNEWLRFFANTPQLSRAESEIQTEKNKLRCFATLCSGAENWEDLTLRPEHTHFFGIGGDPGVQNQGGHYHGDVFLQHKHPEDKNGPHRHPEDIHYSGYFYPAEWIVRINDAAKMMQRGARL